MTILDEIAANTKERIAKRKKETPSEAVCAQAEAMNAHTGFPFEQALSQQGISLICEVKKASPSKGVIAPDFPYVQIAREYEAAGAAAISCLTEPNYFQGQDRYLQEIASQVSIPVLRKDFTVDPYMIYEAKLLGASAVLLICAILSDGELKEYLTTAHSLGLSALVEAHTEEEVQRAIQSGARVIGVNNRDLKTFQVDLSTSLRLRGMVPQEILFVSESGIRGTEDIVRLYQNGTDAVLVGETLMRSPDKKQILTEWMGACKANG
ncbi:MAG: indole-3-glycerol phosphate synthase TrpC [Eubacterium sp.]|nr:indole-3-glycerol phosphate synthase TrpC [Eubacterium sp.]